MLFCSLKRGITLNIRVLCSVLTISAFVVVVFDVVVVVVLTLYVFRFFFRRLAVVLVSDFLFHHS